MTDLDLPPWPWDTPHRFLLDHLTQQLTARLHSGPMYLLIDPAFGEPPCIEVADAGSQPGELSAARQAAWGRTTHTLHDSKYRRPKELTFPYLVRIAGEQDPMLATSIEWACRNT